MPRLPDTVDSGELDAGQPLGVYVHFPFCSVHCPYCDFAVEVRDEIPHDRYADAVITEIAARRAWFAGAPMVSIYFGGGTPGLWRPSCVARIVESAREAFGAPPASALEITIEANPGELDAAQSAALRAAGVNRLSLGVQSFDDRLLGIIGRNHRSDAAIAAVQAARAAGIDNISCDLMFGLPEQDMDAWRRSVDTLLALRPDHVSAYALTIERGTPFGALDRARRLPRPDDDLVAAMAEWGRDALAAAGFAQYEVSSYARPGRRAVHNSLYWRLAAFLGVGASASSFRPLLDGSGFRFANPRATNSYLRAAASDRGSPAPAHAEKRTARDLESEAVWLGLRTSDGIDRLRHRQRYGLDPIDGREAAAAHCVRAGWLVVSDAGLTVTPSGFLFADEVARRLWDRSPLPPRPLRL